VNGWYKNILMTDINIKPTALLALLVSNISKDFTGFPLLGHSYTLRPLMLL